MSDLQQLQAIAALFLPAFRVLLVIVVASIAAIVWDDWKQPQ